jgi:twinkle protein
MNSLTEEEIAPYLQIEEEQTVRPSSDFTQEVLEHYLAPEQTQGVVLPFGDLGDRFRLREGECTILAGINSSGKSLLAGQLLLASLTQNVKCLSVSLEMSPRSQLVRLYRQASLDSSPDIDFALEFSAWSSDKLYFFDKMGSVDLNTLMAVIRYSIDKFNTRMILVDSLMTIAGIANDDYTAQKRIVLKIAETVRDLQCHIILVAHARKSMSIKDKIDRFSIRGAGELADVVDNVLLLQRYYSNNPGEASALLSISKARHWDMAECEMDLFLDLPSLNAFTEGAVPQKLAMGAPATDG